ncbi:hypothetical protein IYX23_19680 [Methylocystis sp. L43]|uniref:hypothetical protein n=1 Tax=unclassified Methylocystis TaxID=2625913 RepID=UPI0018C3079E|nr:MULTISPECIES: hypothetical protein [unclassified Methylocystis]MBG0799892.1 hypothetical protein [Methylocystis sp. L43]MBG0807675.1 hypothetical protein [Methylocystis sp. H15]
MRNLPDIEKLEDAGLLQRSANEIELDGMLRMRDRDAIEFVEAVDDEEDYNSSVARKRRDNAADVLTWS